VQDKLKTCVHASAESFSEISELAFVQDIMQYSNLLKLWQTTIGPAALWSFFQNNCEFVERCIAHLILTDYVYYTTMLTSLVRVQAQVIYAASMHGH